MTILIGFIYRKNREQIIVLGSDSQLTGVGSSSSVVQDARKIVEIKFANGKALLAKAGMTPSADRFEEIFAERAAAKTLSKPRDVADVAEDAIRDLRTQLLRRYPKTLDARQHLLDHECGFMLGYFFGGTPYIYTIGLNSPLAQPAKGKTATMGCAASLANFLLTGVRIDEEDVERVTDVVLCTIELCKLHDGFCGGNAQAGMIDSVEATIWPSIPLTLAVPAHATHAEKHLALVRRLSGQDKPLP